MSGSVTFETSDGLREAIRVAAAQWRSGGKLNEIKRQIAARIVEAQAGGETSVYVTRMMPTGGPSRREIIQWLTAAGCGVEFVDGDRPGDSGDWRVSW